MTIRSRRFGFALWLDDGRPSGANRRLRALVRELPGLVDDDETVVLLLGASTPAPPEHPRVEIVRTGIPATPTLRRASAERRRLPALCRELRLSSIDLQALPIPRLAGTPVVCTIHDLRGLGPFARRPGWIHRAALRGAARRVPRFVVPSQATADRLARVLDGQGPRTVNVVPNAADQAFFAIERRRGPRPIVLHCGHLERRKNLGVLVRAVAASTNPDLVLRLVGDDGGERRALESLARSLGIADRVDFAGAVDEPTLHRHLADCALVAIPSLEEGYGLPAIEALAAGCPTLVSAHAALPEVVGDAGEVVPGEDAARWAAAIESTLGREDDPQRIEARRRRAASFDWKVSAQLLLDVWRSVADDAQTASR